jgi:hypothetical protein
MDPLVHLSETNFAGIARYTLPASRHSGADHPGPRASKA